jgi:hypothetical protein
MERNKVLDGIRGAAPVEVGGQPVVLKCRWCDGPLTDITKDECGMCHELKMLMSKRSRAAVRMLGVYTNVGATLIETIGHVQVLPNGFPEGMYESLDLKDKETALMIFKDFGTKIRDSIASYMLNKMLEIGLASMAPEKDKGRIIKLNDG